MCSCVHMNFVQEHQKEKKRQQKKVSCLDAIVIRIRFFVYIILVDKTLLKTSKQHSKLAKTQGLSHIIIRRVKQIEAREKEWKNEVNRV